MMKIIYNCIQKPFLWLACLMGLFLLAPQSLEAQDVIFQSAGDTLVVKVTEINTTEIKYRFLEEPDGPVYAIDRSKVLKIRYASGREEFFDSNPLSYDKIEDQKINALKFNLLGIAYGRSTFHFERSVKPGRSVEASLNIIGLGINNGIDDDDRTGLGFAVGYKFIRLPDYYVPGMRLRHVMHGAYAKATVHFGFYETDYREPSSSIESRKDIAYLAGIISVGKQWVFNNAIVLDFDIGAGLGGDNLREELAVSHSGVSRLLGEGFGLAFNSNLKIGFLFGKDKQQQRSGR